MLLISITHHKPNIFKVTYIQSDHSVRLLNVRGKKNLTLIN